MANCLPAPLIVNGVVFPDAAQWGLSVSEQPIGGSTVLRLCDGQAVKQTVWRKRRLTLSAQGAVPPPLASIDWSQPVSVSGAGIAPITGFSDGPQVQTDVFGALWSWSLSVEEQ